MESGIIKIHTPIELKSLDYPAHTTAEKITVMSAKSCVRQVEKKKWSIDK